MLRRFSLFVFILFIGLTAGQTKQEIEHDDLEIVQSDNPMSVRPIWPSTNKKTVRGKSIGLPGSLIPLDTALASKLSCAPEPLKEVLRKAQNDLGKVSIVSGYRSPEYNRRVGGSKHSYHTRCQAADVRISGLSPSAVAMYFSKLDSVGGIGTYSNHSFVHIDIGPKRSWHYGRKRRK